MHILHFYFAQQYCAMAQTSKLLSGCLLYQTAAVSGLDNSNHLINEDERGITLPFWSAGPEGIIIDDVTMSRPGSAASLV